MVDQPNRRKETTLRDLAIMDWAVLLRKVVFVDRLVRVPARIEHRG